MQILSATRHCINYANCCCSCSHCCCWDSAQLSLLSRTKRFCSALIKPISERKKRERKRWEGERVLIECISVSWHKTCPTKYAIIISLASFALVFADIRGPRQLQFLSVQRHTETARVCVRVCVCGETFEATVPETNTHITVTRLARDVDDVTRHSNNVKLWFLHGMQMETRRWRNRSGANKNSV